MQAESTGSTTQTAGEVHPAADLFPMMTGDELQALADDIRENGLRQPVVLDGEGRVLDGRNRLAACELVGVEPVFASVNGDDPVALVVSLNVKRRNMTAGQRAVSAAEAWDLVPKRGQSTHVSGRTHEHLAAMFGVSAKYVQQARQLVEHAPDLARQAKAGLMSMATAAEELRTREAEEREREAEAERRRVKIERVRLESPDLIEALERGERDIVEVLADHAEREARARAAADDEAHSRRVLTESLSEAVNLLQLRTDGESVANDLARLDQAVLTDRWTTERVGRAAEYLATLHGLMEGTAWART
jgi:ParB-like chromosome segregation protein Spo0J